MIATVPKPLDGLTEELRQPLAARLLNARSRELVVTALEYVVLIVLATEPAILYLRSCAIGDPWSDMWKHLWGLWWYKDALLNQHTVPLFTTLINYPQGGYLYFADPLTAVASVPLQPLLGLVCTYNVLMLAQVLGGCMGAYLLGRELGLQRPGAFLSGLIYGLSPYVLSYSVGSGVTETVNLLWPPLYLVYLMRSLRGDGLRAQVAAGVVLFLTAFGCWYYSEFMLLMTFFCVVLGAPYASSEATRSGRLHNMFERARRTAPILVVGFCLILPFAAAFAQTLKNPYNLVTPDKHGAPDDAPVERTGQTAGDFLGENQLNFTGLADFLLPGKDNATTTVSMDRLTRVYYLGWIALGLVAAGLVLARPWNRAIHFWLWTTLAFVYLSLGPVIHMRSTAGAPGLCNSWPYWIMFYGFPLFKQVGQPFRLMLLVYLGIGILAGFGLQQLSSRFGGLRRWTWVVALGVLAETLYASPTLYPLPLSPAAIPPVYNAIAADTTDEAVWDVPEERPPSLLQPSEYYYYQTFHRHPIPYRTSGQVSPQVRTNPVHAVLVQLLYQGRVNEEDAVAQISAGKDELKDMKIRWFIMHRQILGPQRTVVLKRCMIAAIGPPYYEDDAVVAFRLYEGPGGPDRPRTENPAGAAPP